MINKLGEFLRDERLRQGLLLDELARLVGYRNVNKGMRRITALEQTGTGKADLLVNVASALNLDWAVVEELAEEDHQDRLREWDRWVNQPVPIHMVVRLMACIYCKTPLPEWVTTPEQAEAWASEFAREHRWRVCLVVSRRLSVWIDAFGLVEARTTSTPGIPNLPVGGLRFLLD
jgi:transcriptional regulator with XRE-family HTH domain